MGGDGGHICIGKLIEGGAPDEIQFHNAKVSEAPVTSVAVTQSNLFPASTMASDRSSNAIRRIVASNGKSVQFSDINLSALGPDCLSSVGVLKTTSVVNHGQFF